MPIMPPSAPTSIASVSRLILESTRKLSIIMNENSWSRSSEAGLDETVGWECWRRGCLAREWKAADMGEDSFEPTELGDMGLAYNQLVAIRSSKK